MSYGKKRPHGEVRQSQMLTTYGPGALIDLPTCSVIIGGLDSWTETGRKEIAEPRLIERIREKLGGAPVRLATPPAEEAAPGAPEASTGVVVWQFPRWFVAQGEPERRGEWRGRALVYANDLDKGMFVHDGVRRPVVPIRFVQACVRGHIEDIEWRYFVRHKEAGCRRQLWLEERGTSGDFADIQVRCECGGERSLAAAKEGVSGSANPLGTCRGRRPWLGKGEEEKCTEPNRLLVRHASHAYFAQTLSLIHIPDTKQPLREAVTLVWDNVCAVESTDDVKYERKKPKVAAALADFDDDEVFDEIQRRNSKATTADKRPLKHLEAETLIAQTTTLVDDVKGKQFLASALPKIPGPKAIVDKLEKVVLVHRLTEVRALLGFTRFENRTPNPDGELDLDVALAPLAADPTLPLPAVENQGEGVFVALKPSAVAAWLKRKPVEKRAERLKAGQDAYLVQKKKPAREYAAVYAMLHSLSHLLMTAVSLECGYPMTAIKERVYATPAALGVLLYTGTSDAQGTLGGLVDVGRHIDEHLRRALDLGRLCSSDPVCAQHEPASLEERRFLHGAACHGCLLLSEHSCEMGNELLDRALVVPTVSDGEAAFFADVFL